MLDKLSASVHQFKETDKKLLIKDYLNSFFVLFKIIFGLQVVYSFNRLSLNFILTWTFLFCDQLFRKNTESSPFSIKFCVCLFTLAGLKSPWLF